MNMNILEVSNALKHVHNNLDAGNQWIRAGLGLAAMSELERAQVWKTLSSHTLALDQPKAAVVLSQYRTLYKAALKRWTTPQTEQNHTDAVVRVDENAEEVLTEYKGVVQRYSDLVNKITRSGDSSDEAVIVLRHVLDDTLLVDHLKAGVADALKEIVLKQDEILKTQNEMKATLQDINEKTGIGKIGNLILDDKTLRRQPSLRDIHDKISGLSGDIARLESETKALQTALSAFPKDISEFQQKLHTLDTATSFQEEMKRFEKLLKQGPYNQQFLQWKSHFAEFESEMEKMTSTVKRLASEAAKDADAANTAHHVAEEQVRYIQAMQDKLSGESTSTNPRVRRNARGEEFTTPEPIDVSRL
jgi:chromosome segregation ATPase